MTPERTRFDDPRLRAAVRRAWAGETAPPELRARVEELIAEETAAGQAGGPTPDVVIRRPALSFWRRSVALGSIAAAAVVIVGVGLVAFNASRPGTAPAVATSAGSPAAPSAPAVLPTELGQQLVRGHDLCVRVHGDEHHLLKHAPKHDYPAMARELEGKVKYPVLATPVGGDWAFHGASVCPVGKMRVAHLMYTQGDAFLSLYSLPASSIPTVSDQQSCEAAVNGRPVAGFVVGKTFYAVLASTGGKTPVDLDGVRAVRDQLRETVVASGEPERIFFLAVAR
jgi:hypothetical protein